MNGEKDGKSVSGYGYGCRRGRVRREERFGLLISLGVSGLLLWLGCS